jgi:hypothetical protein
MKATTNDKEKGATSAVTRQQPLKYSESPSLTPKRQQQGEPSSGDAELQGKMMEAARETYNFEWEDQGLETLWEYDIARAKLFFCTPDGVLYKLVGREWIQVTEENLVKVLLLRGSSPGLASFVLKQIRQSCERTNKVGWVLPKLSGGVSK